MNDTNIILAINNELISIGIEKFLIDKKIKHSISIHKKLEELNILKESSILIFSIENKKDQVLISKLIVKYPNLRTILFCSPHKLTESIFFAKQVGLDASVCDNIRLEKLFDLIQRISARKQFVPLIYSDKTNETFVKGNLPEKITFSDREIEVLHYVGLGKTNLQVAKILSLSHKTIETHRRRMIERMEATNIIPVILYAHASNFIPLEPRL